MLQKGRDLVNKEQIGKNICSLRKGMGMTQDELAGRLNISYQAISKWENGSTMPDISLLPELAFVFGTSIDSILGYAAEKKHSTYYEEIYVTDEYYWGVKPTSMCYDVLRIMPPDRPLKLLDIGCGEGRNAVFFAQNGYIVSAFDITRSGIEKAKRLADGHKVEINFFNADILDYRLESNYDIVFCSGVLEYIPEGLRTEIFDNYKYHTTVGGINAMNAFVKKPFIYAAPDKESSCNQYKSGELFGYYHDWRFEQCKEEIFDCMSGGKPHKHCMDTLIAVKTV